MAIYNLSVKAVQRSKGRSSVAAAAYRSRAQLHDERQGITFAYTAKEDLVHDEIIGWDHGREKLWNVVELSEKRKDATTAKEYQIAIPRELSLEQQKLCVREYGTWLNERFGCAVDICIHHDKAGQNPHAHIMTTTRSVIGDQLSSEKIARDWSDAKRKKHGMPGRKSDLVEAREKWTEVANSHLKSAGCSVQISHQRGLNPHPQIKLGSAAAAMERRGRKTGKGNIRRSQKLANSMHFQKLRMAGNDFESKLAQIQAGQAMSSLHRAIAEADYEAQLQAQMNEMGY